MTIDLDIHAPAIAERNQSAFANWMAAAEQSLRLHVAGFARTVDTEAVVQETLLRVWQVAPRFQPDGRPNALLRMAFRIARNTAITEHRRRFPGCPLPADLADDLPASPIVEADELLRQSINQCLDLLPRAPRAAINARVALAGVRDEQIAASVGMKPNTFFQNVRRARVALLRCLKARGVRLEVES